MTDEELVRKARAGSLSAFEELVYRHERGVFSFVRRRCRNVADATDLTQTTFVKAYRCLHQHRPGASFKAWLFTIARNLSISHYRSTRETTNELPASLSDDTDPSIILGQREAAETVWSVARTVLPESQSTALWLKYGEDMSLKEIALAMGKSVAHVKVLLHRGRTRLAKRLGEMDLKTKNAALDRIEEAHDVVCHT